MTPKTENSETLSEEVLRWFCPSTNYKRILKAHTSAQDKLDTHKMANLRKML